MASPTAVSKRATPARNLHAKSDAHARAHGVSLTQQPRSFDYTADFLAQSAASAYRNNPAYVAIEKETLNAVAPFLEITRKHVRAKSTSSLSPAATPVSPANGYNPIVSSNTSFDLGTSPVKSHRCTISGSSISLEDSRHGVRSSTKESSSIIPEDLECPDSALGSSPASLLSTGKPSSSYITRSPPSSILANRRLSLGTSTESLNFRSSPTSSHVHALGLSNNTATSQPLETLQDRLNSLNLGSASPRNVSTSTIVPIIAPDPAFLLTKFIHDSVRLYSPSKQEIEEKHRLQVDLESILQVVQPTASLVLFGSVKNGLALANADLDLMVVDQSPMERQLHDLHVDLPGLYAEALRTQGYSVKLLTKTRIPLIKILREYVAGAFSIDISFDNPLALHNTRLMATYNACDPRFRLLVMFIKLWARARRINDSFAGTLKSYGYMIMLIYYLQNKASPALLPNLQMISPSGRAVSADELECQGFDIWYAKDVSRMHAIQQNSQSIGELIEGFFSHFAYEFDYRDWVISINVFGGLQTKESKRWTQLVEHMNENGSARVKDRFILCVSDPFEISHNVARTVTRAGLYEIRGSMMAAVRAIRGTKLTDLLTPSI